MMIYNIDPKVLAVIKNDSQRNNFKFKFKISFVEILKCYRATRKYQ